ncbi:MAG: ankyrin repeat domain-containing protein [Bacteroidetes bacterium]|nr:ankyrin repeat domain-containing protein [Bacteroidota bacterium]
MEPNIIRGALNNDFEEVAAALVLSPESINNVDQITGGSALHISVGLGNYSMVAYLVEQEGLNLEHKDQIGRDALDLAIQIRHPKILELLYPLYTIDLV